MMSGREAAQSVRWALAAGYRGFDCAQMYHNEREAGRAIRDFLSGDESENAEGLARGDVHYTTKLASCSTSYDAARRSIRQSVDACGLGWVDLMLLHSPHGGREARLASWRALEDAVEAGEVRMAGVSNFGVRHVSAFHLRDAAPGGRETIPCRAVFFARTLTHPTPWPTPDRGADGIQPKSPSCG